MTNNINKLVDANAAASELRRIRTEKGLTLKEAAKKIGISVIFLSELERNIKAPSALIIHAIAQEYELNETELATAYGKIPIGVQADLTKHKGFTGALLGLKKSNIPEDEKDDLFNRVADLFNEHIRRHSE